jgi:hypothetical protein
MYIKFGNNFVKNACVLAVLEEECYDDKYPYFFNSTRCSKFSHC